jgi:hypothetical protein
LADLRIIELPVGSYVSGNFLVTVNSLNSPFRVPLSAFAEAGHDHADEILRFDRVDSNNSATLLIQTTNGAAKIRLKASSGAMLNLYGPSGTTPGGVILDADNEQVFKAWADGRISFANAGFTSAPYGLKTKDDAAWKNVGHAWELYSSHLTTKQNVAPIQTPEAKLNKIRGLTYTKDGNPETGFVVEELEQMDLPGLITKGDKEDPNKITSYNPIAIVANIVEALKALTTRVAALEGKK